MTKRKPKKVAVSFLLHRGDKFYLVPLSVLENLPIEEAFNLGILAKLAQSKQLIEDAMSGDHFISGIKVVDGLEASISKLIALYPSLPEHIKNLTATNNIRTGQS